MTNQPRLAFKLSRSSALELMHSLQDTLTHPDEELELAGDQLLIVVPVNTARYLRDVIGTATGATGDQVVIDDITKGG